MSSIAGGGVPIVTGPRERGEDSAGRLVGDGSSPAGVGWLATRRAGTRARGIEDVGGRDITDEPTSGAIASRGLLTPTCRGLGRNDSPPLAAAGRTAPRCGAISRARIGRPTSP